jgi:L-threonylcarbamoyladenylate synthase
LAEILSFESGLERALAALSAGEPVAVPTETVYGLAADAASGEAVARIFEAKGRPRFNPLILHVSDMAMAERYARFDPLARRLAERFWPGPLTLVLPLLAGAEVAPLALAGLETVALRVPQGPARELIARFGRPLAAPSANRSGRVSPTTAQAVAADLGDRISLVLDAGPTSVGLESTILRPAGEGVELLRPGGLAADEIEAALPVRLLRPSGSAIVAPGMLRSHYAPRAAMRLDAGRIAPGEALLAFGPERIAGAETAAAIRNLSPAGDLREAAANLFSMMRELDDVGAAVIAVEPIPGSGLGEAINDRLARAAAPRDAS